MATGSVKNRAVHLRSIVGRAPGHQLCTYQICHGRSLTSAETAAASATRGRGYFVYLTSPQHFCTSVVIMPCSVTTCMRASTVDALARNRLGGHMNSPQIWSVLTLDQHFSGRARSCSRFGIKEDCRMSKSCHSFLPSGSESHNHIVNQDPNHPLPSAV